LTPPLADSKRSPMNRFARTADNSPHDLSHNPTFSTLFLAKSYVSPRLMQEWMARVDLHQRGRPGTDTSANAWRLDRDRGGGRPPTPATPRFALICAPSRSSGNTDKTSRLHATRRYLPLPGPFARRQEAGRAYCCGPRGGASLPKPIQPRFRLHSRPPRQRLPSSLPYRKCLGSELRPSPTFSPPRHFRSRLTTTRE
jgi:hypothetical protein